MSQCKDCKRLIKINSNSICQCCLYKQKRNYNFKFFLTTRYTVLKQRCINKKGIGAKSYFGRAYCTKKEFLDKFLCDEKLKEMYKHWQLNNFERKLCPSVDRIDNKRGYEITNIQFLTTGTNSSKDQYKRVTKVFDMKGNLLSVHESFNSAVNHYNVFSSNARGVAIGKRTHTNGLVFKFKKAS